jgi:hypothetical protein
MIQVSKPLFRLGQIVATPGAHEALEKAGQVPFEFIARHAKGDWGELSEEDRRLNDEAVKDGSRILSAYRLKTTAVKIWIITEAEDDQGHRAATTILLPEEY